ncbi:hypothetical protein [Hyalangium rubrum]|uniref:Photosynthesis system II assembly factor Ycf48/Hcf136-like domain-containing protein n=1 Tax=Hyalangium rubrum TaxID=3103134 RepID=A0ABU5HG03_9BACT|nr:hypothetical protein [Hyalangium sp. s54d21]MDY7232397.1 hypothetical protein [Hyalangium sp. s54d21]
MKRLIVAALLSMAATGFAKEPAKVKAAPAPKLIIVGVGYPGITNLRGAIGLSRDGGKTFKEVWYKDKEGASVENVIYVPETKLFVAVGRAGILTSPDGENWKQVELPKAARLHELHSVAYGNGWYVAVGDKTDIIVSKDAQTWVASWANDKGEPDIAKMDAMSTWFEQNSKGLAPGRMNYTDVAFVNGKFLAVGYCHRVLEIIPTEQGATFGKVEDLEPEDCTKSAKRIRQHGDAIVVSGNRAFLSKDGAQTWKELRALKAAGDKWALGVGPQGFITASTYGNFLSSPDGEKWTQLTKYTRATPQDIAWIGGQWWMVGQGANTYWTSPDGKEWTELNFTVDSEEAKMTQSYTGIVGVELK